MSVAPLPAKDQEFYKAFFKEVAVTFDNDNENSLLIHHFYSGVNHGELLSKIAKKIDHLKAKKNLVFKKNATLSRDQADYIFVKNNQIQTIEKLRKFVLSHFEEINCTIDLEKKGSYLDNILLGASIWNLTDKQATLVNIMISNGRIPSLKKTFTMPGNWAVLPPSPSTQAKLDRIAADYFNACL